MRQPHLELISRYLSLHQRMTHEDAERLLQVSAVTVRRLFQELSAAHQVLRFHGGICLPLSTGNVVPIALRENRGRLEKELLARRAVDFLPADRLNMIHGGTTTEAMAKYLTGGTILTDSVNLTVALNRRFPNGEGPKLVLTGGIVDPKAGFLSGPKAQQIIRSYAGAVFVTSVRALDGEGLLETDEQTVAIMRAMMASCDKTIVVADHLKFQCKGDCRLAAWPEIALLITTNAPGNARALAALRSAGVTLDVLNLPNNQEE